MVSIFSRKYAQGSDCKLSIRVKSNGINTAFALGINVSESRWRLINDTLKQARAAYKRGSTVFIDEPLTSKLWQLLRALIIKESAGSLTAESITFSINEHLHIEELKEFEAEVNRQREYENILKERKKPTLTEYMRLFVDDCRKGNRLANGEHKYSKGTYGHYGSFVSAFEKFQTYTGRVVDWDEVTFDTLALFKSYLYSSGYKVNTIAKYISVFKTILSAAHDAKLTTTTDFTSKRWSASSVSVNNVYITTERINSLYNADFSSKEFVDYCLKNIDEEHRRLATEGIRKLKSTKNLNRARDIFIMGCLTGQRISDYKRMSADMVTFVNGKQFLRLIQQKTKTEVYIPMSPRINEILERYNGVLPSMYEEDLKQRVRLCAILLGWTEDSGIDGKRFYECITTHTARRSFATNAYKSNIPLSAIMAVTGHASEQMLRKYLKLDKQDKAVMAAEAFEKLGFL